MSAVPQSTPRSFEQLQAPAGAPARPGRQGDRRLPHDRARRSRDGVPVRRQGLVHAARHPAVAPAQRAGRLRADRRQSRSEAAGLSRARAARLSHRARRAVPHHRAGHVQRREARDPRRQDDVRPVLAPAARRAVSLRRRERHHQDRARPSSRRHRRDAVPQHVLRRQAEGDAAEAAHPKTGGTSSSGRSRTSPSATSSATRAPGNFRSFRARCAARRTTCSAWRSRRCCANGSSSTRAAPSRSSPACATSCRRTWPTRISDPRAADFSDPADGDPFA